MPILQMKCQLALHTRCEYQIRNNLDRRPEAYTLHASMERWKKKFPNELHRPVGPSHKYNCHGLTFASRRTEVENPQDILKILEDDDYRKVSPDTVLPGDIVIYYGPEGDVIHSGIVTQIEQPLKVPVVLSKWSNIHEVVHRVGNCPYEAQNVIYYRIHV